MEYLFFVFGFAFYFVFFFFLRRRETKEIDGVYYENSMYKWSLKAIMEIAYLNRDTDTPKVTLFLIWSVISEVLQSQPEDLHIDSMKEKFGIKELENQQCKNQNDNLS